MMKKLIGSALAAALLLSGAAYAVNPEITEADAERIYCGDPAAMVEGDTVYLYVGHDVGDGSYYDMPDYLCYSSKDMLNWKYEGVPLRAGDFPWGKNKDAWAGHVVRYKDKYYFFNCKNGTGISVAVSDSPTGPFVNAIPDGRLVFPNWTNGRVSWDDIDPAVFIETDESGIEHRYICWGNSDFYLAELTEDMTSLTDRNGDGTVNGGDILKPEINGLPNGRTYTEAPWIYKRGELYYLFFANNFHEELSYATAKSIYGPYEYGGLLMETGASSNTNHPAVIDFKGKTYLFYHTGAQPNGGGYLRNVCIDTLVFDEYGGIAQLEESSIGLDGNAVKLSFGGKPLFHSNFKNSYSANDYPSGATLRLGGNELFETDSMWVLTDAGDGRVYIESQNKMGYYITNYNGYVKLLHDCDNTAASLAARTFIMKEADGGLTFESASEKGLYLYANSKGQIVLSEAPTVFTSLPARGCSFVTAQERDGAITVEAVGQNSVTAVVILCGEGITETALCETDENGYLCHSFAPQSGGEYEIYCLGKTVRVSFGGVL